MQALVKNKSEQTAAEPNSRIDRKKNGAGSKNQNPFSATLGSYYNCPCFDDDGPCWWSHGWLFRYG